MNKRLLLIFFVCLFFSVSLSASDSSSILPLRLIQSFPSKIEFLKLSPSSKKDTVSLLQSSVQFYMSSKQYPDALETLKLLLSYNYDASSLKLAAQVLASFPTSESLNPKGVLYTMIPSSQIRDIVLENLALEYLSLNDLSSFRAVGLNLSSELIRSRLIRYQGEYLIKKGSVPESLKLLPFIKDPQEKDLFYSYLAAYYAENGSVSLMESSLALISLDTIKSSAVIQCATFLLERFEFAPFKTLLRSVLDPVASMQLRVKYVSLLASQGQFEDAYRECSQISDTYYKDEAFLALALELIDQKQFEPAGPVIQKITTESLMLKGWYALSLGQAKEEQIDASLLTADKLKASSELYLNLIQDLGKAFSNSESHYYALLRLKQIGSPDIQELAVSEFLVASVSSLSGPKIVQLSLEIKNPSLQKDTLSKSAVAYTSLFKFEDAFSLISALPDSPDKLALILSLAEAWGYNTSSKDVLRPLFSLSASMISKAPAKLDWVSTGFYLSALAKAQGMNADADILQQKTLFLFNKLPLKDKHLVSLPYAKSLLLFGKQDEFMTLLSSISSPSEKVSFLLSLYKEMQGQTQLIPSS